MTSLPLPHLAKRWTTAMGCAGGDTTLKHRWWCQRSQLLHHAFDDPLDHGSAITTLSDKSLRMSTSHFVTFRETCRGFRWAPFDCVDCVDCAANLEGNSSQLLPKSVRGSWVGVRPTGPAWRHHAPHGQQDKPGTTCQPHAWPAGEAWCHRPAGRTTQTLSSK